MESNIVTLQDYTLSQEIVADDKPVIVKAMSKRTGKFVAIKYFPPKATSSLKVDYFIENIKELLSLNDPHIIITHELILNDLSGKKDGEEEKESGKEEGKENNEKIEGEAAPNEEGKENNENNEEEKESGAKESAYEMYIVMEWCDGSSIRNTLDRFKSLPEKLIYRYVVEVLHGLSYLKTKNMQHRNLKASNLLLVNGVLKLAGFGLSAEVFNKDASKHPYWSAPEVLNGGNFSEKSDIWSLGATIIELITGHPPYGTLSPEEAAEKLKEDTPVPIPEGVSPELVEFLQKCLQRDPNNRPSIDECFEFEFLKKRVEDEKKELEEKAQQQKANEENVLTPKPAHKLTIKPVGDVVKDWETIKTFNATETKDTEDSLKEYQEDDNTYVYADNDNTPLKKLAEIPTSRGVISKGDIVDGLSDNEDLGEEALKERNKRKVTFIQQPPKEGKEEADKKGNKEKVSPISILLNSLELTNSTVNITDEKLDQFREQGDDDTKDANENKAGGTLHFAAVNNKHADFSDFDDFDKIDENNEEDAKVLNIILHRIDVENLTKDLITELQKISTNMEDSSLQKSFETVRSIIAKEKSVRSSIIEHQCLVPVIEIIGICQRLKEETRIVVLEAVYDIINNEEEIKESFCLLGGIPPVITFLQRKSEHGEETSKNIYSKEVRTLAMKIIVEIWKTKFNNIQMFIACGGITSLVQTLSYDIKDDYDLIFLAITNIALMLNKNCGIQQVDFGRLFTTAGLIEPLSTVLSELVNNQDIANGIKELEQQIHNICFIIEKLSEGDDSKVKLALSAKEIIRNIVSSMYDIRFGKIKKILHNEDIFLLCTALKSISADSDTRDSLQKARTLEMATKLVSNTFGPNKENGDTEDMTIKIHTSLIHFISNMCDLSEERLAIVARSGIIKALKPYLVNETQLKGLTMYVFLGFTRLINEKDVMNQLIKEGLIDIYVSALVQQYWGARAMIAISQIVPNFDIFPILIREENIINFHNSIDCVNLEHMPTMFSSLSKICLKSEEFKQKLIASRPFAIVVISKLSTACSLHEKDSQIPTAVLEFVDTVFKGENTPTLFMNNEIKRPVNTFAAEGNLKQKDYAKRILKQFAYFESREK